MQLRRLLFMLCTNPPHTVARRAMARATRTVAEHRRRRADLQSPTYCRAPFARTLQSYWPNVATPLTANDLTALRETSDHFLNHRFDLLGSGWVRVRHGMHCRGLSGQRYESGPPVHPSRDGRWLHGRINSANLDGARQAWRLVDPEYVPIDWNLDFKSGYRWNEATWYRDIRFGHAPGADVKVPWELARMQHLPRLAWAHALAASGIEGFRDQNVYAREFRNQVLDFIATNPPRFGVNWSSSMDVGIRAANWLVAYDWLRSAGATWDSQFEATFVDGIEAHGRHIVQNLDWEHTWRGNHYLANIVGLLFVAAYLPRSATVDAWLALAVQELIAEVRCQFAADGSNIEASTSYHRLSAEMVAFGTALVLAVWPNRRDACERYDHCLVGRRPGLAPAPLPRYELPADQCDSPFPPWYFERLERMAQFTLHVTKPTRRIHQVGDNDSGRFLNLQPVYSPTSTGEVQARFANLENYGELSDRANYWIENHLDHRSLVAAIAGLIERRDFAHFAGTGRIETALVRGLSGGIQWTARHCVAPQRQHIGARDGNGEPWNRLQRRLAETNRWHRYVYRIELPDTVGVKDLERIAYPDFGLFIWRSSCLYLAVRCGPRRQSGLGAHAHNDQLSLELSIDEHDVFADPGSYLYTPDPHERNRYRSVQAHWSPLPMRAREPGRIARGLFELHDRARAECLYFGPRGFAGMHRGYGRPVFRIVEWEPQAIVITDVADRALRLRETWPGRPGQTRRERIPFSAGYGIVEAAHASPGAAIVAAECGHLRPRIITSDVHIA
ncbi:MAG: heparinase II/III family protein [Pirellulales bacterium]